MGNLTNKELHYQLHYNPLNGIFIWKHPAKHSKMNPGEIAGTLNSEGYIQISIDGQGYLAHRLAWFYYYGYWPEKDIDHRNKKRHCNWILNLRQASQQCNSRNRRIAKNNTSGVKGVYLDKKYNKWYASIKVSKRKYLGSYKEFDNAVCARLAGEQCVGWDGCDINSPAYIYVKENIQGG